MCCRLQGQLGHGADETVCLAPRMIDQMMDDNLVFTHLQCGVYHNAAITNDGDVYTWGRNLDNALGRPGSMALQGCTYAARPVTQLFKACTQTRRTTLD